MIYFWGGHITRGENAPRKQHGPNDRRSPILNLEERMPGFQVSDWPDTSDTSGNYRERIRSAICESVLSVKCVCLPVSTRRCSNTRDAA